MSITFDPYADEDASNNDDTTEASTLGDAEPPVLKAFSHIGKTFRQGGFCTPSPKRKKKKREPLPKVSNDSVEKEEIKPKNEKITGNTRPLYILLVFTTCVVSSLMFCYKPEISIVFERKVDDIMTSTQLYSFEISLMVALFVLVITKLCMSYTSMKTKVIQYVWATFICVIIGLTVFYLTKTESKAIPSSIPNTNDLQEKKAFFHRIFAMKK